MNQWEIIDNQGTIYSGSEDEMTLKFSEIVNGEIEDEWEGDLRLIQVHGIHK